MKLRHVVITSVDRDDLKNDYGADIWAKTIQQIRIQAPNCTIEVLTPDFRDYRPAFEKVFQAAPDIFSHNIECVQRISKAVRPQSDWNRSFAILRASIAWGLQTKTGMMVGLGENDDEVFQTKTTPSSIIDSETIVNVDNFYALVDGKQQNSPFAIWMG